MSFFKKALGAMGIGAAKVDTQLFSTEVMPGEEVAGVIKITGGKVEQTINKLDLEILCNYTVEREITERDDEGEESTRTVTEERNHLLNSFTVNEAFDIQPGETREIPFAAILSGNAPLSAGKSQTWLKTNLDIEMALDKGDKDILRIVPSRLQGALLQALESMGFELYEVESYGTRNNPFSSLPFIQEFEFKTRSGPFHGKLDELEVVFASQGETLTVYFEIDRKATGLAGFFSEAFDMDESHVSLAFGEADLETMEEQVHNLISAHC